MADMVELPRDPVDFKIDTMSPAARSLLLGFVRENQDFSRYADGLDDLVKMRFADLTGSTLSEEDVEIEWNFTLTWDGQWAREKIRCGAYEHHKQIYAKRAARDAQQEAFEASPIYGSM